jgi:mycofactocin system glycosyltransferase
VPLPPDLVLEVTGRRLPRGRLLGGAPRVLLRVDEQPLQDLAEGAPATRHPALARLLLRTGLASPRPVTTRWTLADVTAVVPVKDDALRLPDALASLAGVARIVVVDDGSTDGTGDVARAAGATVVRHDRPQGPAAARNAGLAAADTPLVVMVDADTTAEPGWVEGLLAALVDPEVLLVAPRVLGLDRRGGSLVERYERVQSPLDQGPQSGLVGPGRDRGYVPAAALLVRREELLALGGFDAALHTGEDVDLCARASAAGWLLRYDASVLVRHDHRTGWRSFVKRRFQYGGSGAQLWLRHPGLTPATSPGGWIAALLLVIAAPRKWAVLGATAAAGATAARTAGCLLRERVPARVAAETAVRSELGSARRFVGTATRYTGLPLTALLAVRSRRARALLAVGSIAMHVRDHRALEPELGVVPFVGLRVLEEASVGTGLWLACLRARSFRPFDPRLAVLPRRGAGAERLTWQAAPRG